MGKDSKIEWTDHTWNPWRGCHKIRPGCKNCYMFREQRQYGHDPNVVVRCSNSTFRAPLRWAKRAKGDSHTLVFTCSWSDFFIEEADPWRGEAWEIIRQTPQLTYLILTKRSGLAHDRLPSDWGLGYENVGLGVSVENMGALYVVRTLFGVLAEWYFASVEPMIGPIEFPMEWLTKKLLSWIIIGGESDRIAPRPMNLDSVRHLIAQGKDAGVPIFVKQLGTAWAREVGARDWKGADWTEWPKDLRVREFPQLF